VLHAQAIFYNYKEKPVSAGSDVLGIGTLVFSQTDEDVARRASQSMQSNHQKMQQI
jgi:hypothetical protein